MNIEQYNLPTHIEPIEQLVTDDAFAQYTSGRQSEHAATILISLHVDDLFENGVADQNMARCCLAGLWLLHNFLHQSHEISQVTKTPEGSLWHAIMHRLEGDFWNSKYWYRSAGRHPSYGEIANDWDPAVFVDRCELQKNGSQEKLADLKQLACTEWSAVFNYCWQNSGK